ncbi:MAG: hypothetical protein EOO08_08605 [Chitinophagaceae bacterium]|nr:MAG: hypothetical protein EOO08_08605 [Chitinophagaceae bacterium]
MRSYLLLFALLCGVCCRSQKIEGFGLLRIGKSYAQILADLQIAPASVAVYDKNDSAFTYTQPDVPAVLQYRYSGTYSDRVVRCERAFLLRLPSYSVSGITVADVRMIFFRDTLLSIFVSSVNDAFIEAMETKYGQPADDAYESPSACTSKRNKITTRTWSNELPAINVQQSRSVYYNGYCDESIRSSFSFVDRYRSNQLDECERATKAEEERRALDKKKEKLKDF